MSIGQYAQGSDVELWAVDGVTQHRDGRKLVMTVDSGAGESVCGPLDAPGCAIQPSEEQRRGTNYLATGGARLPNLGEKHIRIKTQDGKQCRVRMQVTNVRKPLLSVARTKTAGWCSKAQAATWSTLRRARGCSSSGPGMSTTSRSRHSRIRFAPGRGRRGTPTDRSTPREPDRESKGDRMTTRSGSPTRTAARTWRTRTRGTWRWISSSRRRTNNLRSQ